LVRTTDLPFPPPPTVARRAGSDAVAQVLLKVVLPWNTIYSSSWYAEMSLEKGLYIAGSLGYGNNVFWVSDGSCVSSRGKGGYKGCNGEYIFPPTPNED